jgi:hypothetical protein
LFTVPAHCPSSDPWGATLALSVVSGAAAHAASATSDAPAVKIADMLRRERSPLAAGVESTDDDVFMVVPPARSPFSHGPRIRPAIIA